MTARDINNTNTRLKAFRDNPRLHIIGPTPVSTARLDNFVAPNKSIICHANLQIVLETFSHTQRQHSLKIQPIQWGGDGAYGTFPSTISYQLWEGVTWTMLLGYSPCFLEPQLLAPGSPTACLATGDAMLE